MTGLCMLDALAKKLASCPFPDGLWMDVLSVWISTFYKTIQTKRVRAERGGSSLSLLKATTSY